MAPIHQELPMTCVEIFEKGQVVCKRLEKFTTLQ